MFQTVFLSNSGAICRAPNEIKAHDGKMGKGTQTCKSMRWMGVKSPCLQLILDTNNTRCLNATGCYLSSVTVFPLSVSVFMLKKINLQKNKK